MKSNFICSLYLLVSIVVTAQNKSVNPFTISGGFGYSNSLKNTIGSTAAWLQTSYQFSSSFSIAMEFENAQFKTKGVYLDFGYPEKLNTDDQLFLVGLKYIFNPNSKITFSALTGGAYLIRQSAKITKYEQKDINGNIIGTSFDWRTLTDNSFGIPLVCEAVYSIHKRLLLGARVKYNSYINQTNTYTCGLLVGLKL